MPRPTTYHGRVDDDGNLERSVSLAIRDQLQLYSGRPVVIKISPEPRSLAGNRYYWGVVIESVRQGLFEAGRAVSAEDLHGLFKSLYLPPIIRTVMGRSVTDPPSTAILDSTSFSDYIESIKTDEMVRLYEIEIPEPESPMNEFRISEP